jgi:hypothetical protein
MTSLYIDLIFEKNKPLPLLTEGIERKDGMCINIIAWLGVGYTLGLEDFFLRNGKLLLLKILHF